MREGPAEDRSPHYLGRTLPGGLGRSVSAQLGDRALRGWRWGRKSRRRVRQSESERKFGGLEQRLRRSQGISAGWQTGRFARRQVKRPGEKAEAGETSHGRRLRGLIDICISTDF